MPSGFKTRAHCLVLVVVLVNCNDVLHAGSAGDPTSASAGVGDQHLDSLGVSAGTELRYSLLKNTC
jgi:hypothetical protein